MREEARPAVRAQGIQDLADHTARLPLVGLPRTIDIEKPEPQGAHAIEFRIATCEALHLHLGEGVKVLRIGRKVLVVGRFLLPVDGRRGGVDHRDLAVHRELQEASKALHIHGKHDLLVGLRGIRDGGHVDNRVHGSRAEEALIVGGPNIRAHDLSREAVQISVGASPKAIQGDHLASLLREEPGDLRTDEASCARNEDALRRRSHR